MAQVIYPRWRPCLVPWHKLYTKMELVPVPLVPTCAKLAKKWVYKAELVFGWLDTTTNVTVSKSNITTQYYTRQKLQSLNSINKDAQCSTIARSQSAIRGRVSK